MLLRQLIRQLFGSRSAVSLEELRRAERLPDIFGCAAWKATSNDINESLGTKLRKGKIVSHLDNSGA
jgi:hypothetical protein